MSSEPTNADRADWARVGVHAYAEETRHDPREQTVSGETEEDRDHAEEVISDLLCDMRHLADVLGINFQEVLGRSLRDYTQDVAEERHAQETAAIKELLTPDPWGQAGGR